MAVKKVSLYKTALRLCFPRSDELEHEVYQLTCPTNQTAKIKHLSGVICCLFRANISLRASSTILH